MPADRPHIDDRTATRIAHCRDDGLGSEELVLEIDAHALVPIGARNLVEFVAVVVRRIVHENVASAESIDHLRDLACVIVTVGNIAVMEEWLDLGVREPFDQGMARFFHEIDKRDRSALPSEPFDNTFTDTGRTAADYNLAAFQARVIRLRGILAMMAHQLVVLVPLGATGPLPRQSRPSNSVDQATLGQIGCESGDAHSPGRRPG